MWIRKTAAAAALISTLTACASAPASTSPLETPAEPSLEKRLGAKVDEIVQPYEDLAMFSGSVLVSHGGETFTRHYGFAHHAFNQPIDDTTRFYIGSISKDFTLATASSLVREGKLAWSSRVSDFLPDFPRGDDILISQLVAHRSGVPHTNRLPEYAPGTATRLTLDQSIEILSAKPLDFEPGARRRYSNGGYDVLAAVIAQASGEAFQDAVASRVLRPLSLTDTGFGSSYGVVDRMATGYTPSEIIGRPARARFYSPEIRPGGGAMYSTAEDLLTFYTALHAHRFSEPGETPELFGRPDQATQITGRRPGYSTMVSARAATETFVISTANNSAQIPHLNRQILSLLDEEEMTRQSLIPADPDDVDVHPELAGTYNWEGRNSNPFFIETGDDGAPVLFNPTSDYRVALVPLASGKWLHPMIELVCEFEEHDDGQIAALDCKNPVNTGRDNSSRIVRIPN